MDGESDRLLGPFVVGLVLVLFHEQALYRHRRSRAAVSATLETPPPPTFFYCLTTGGTVFVSVYSSALRTCPSVLHLSHSPKLR